MKRHFLFITLLSICLLGHKVALGQDLTAVYHVDTVAIFDTLDATYEVVIYDGSIWERKQGTIPPNGGTIINGPSGSYYERQFLGYIYPQWFGAKAYLPGTYVKNPADGKYYENAAFTIPVTKSDQAIQKAIDYAHSRNAGRVEIPYGVYFQDQKIIGKAHVDLVASDNTVWFATGKQAELRVDDNFTGTQLEYTADNNEGADVYAGRLLGNGQMKEQTSTLKGILFQGGNLSSLTLRRLYLNGIWSLRVEHCTFTATKLFSVEVFDVNAIAWHQNTTGAAALFTGLKDSDIIGNQFNGFGVSGGTIARSPLWISGPNSFQNHIHDNYIYNSLGNVASPQYDYTFTVNTSTNRLTITSHGLVTGTPVVVSSTITLPSPLAEHPTYYVKVIDANTIELWNDVSAYNSNAATLDLTTTGTGTHSLSVGRIANLFMNNIISGYHWNSINGNRLDQSYGVGAEFAGMANVTFGDNTIIMSGFRTDTTTQPGLILRNSTGFTLAGTVIDGRSYTGGIGSPSSHQKQGVLIIQKTGSALHNFTGMIVRNHTDADFVNQETTNTSSFGEDQIKNNSFKNSSGTLDPGNYIITTQRTATDPTLSFYNSGQVVGTFTAMNSGGSRNLMYLPGTGTSNSNFWLQSGGWNNGHLRMGGNHTWVDAAGRFRWKTSAPNSATDGEEVSVSVPTVSDLTSYSGSESSMLVRSTGTVYTYASGSADASDGVRIVVATGKGSGNWISQSISKFISGTATTGDVLASDASNRILSTSSSYLVKSVEAPGFQIAGSVPALSLNENDAASNMKGWLLSASGGNFQMRGVKDNGATQIFASTNRNGSGNITNWSFAVPLSVTGEAAVSALSVGISTKTTAYTVTATDHTIIADATSGAFSVSLPTAIGISGRIYVIKKRDSSGNAVTVATTSSQTIDGAISYTLAARYKFVTVQSDGANWQIIGSN